MANFVKSKLARESVEATGDVIDGLSNVEPAEENIDVQLAEVASIDGQLEQLDGDQETLAADTERTEAAIDAADEKIENGEEMPEEAIAHTEVAQESIRKRWAIDRTKLARESYRRGRGMTKAAQEGWKETLKDLFERFVELCKAVIAKAKELKLKYINVGKSAQKRAKAYQEMLRKLGKQKKENISGGFISKLSIEGEFDVANSIAIAKELTGGKAKDAINKLSSQAADSAVAITKTSDGTATAVKGAVDVALFGTAAKKLRALPQFEDGEGGQKVLALPGNAYVQTGSKTLAGGQEFTAVAFLSTGDVSETKEIATPAISALASAASALDVIGKGFEKVLQDFRSYDADVEKLEEAAAKAAAALKKSNDEGEWEALRNARTAADQAVRNYQTLNRAVAHVGNTVISGLNGYIGAGIGAYEKSKA
ncbi:hypothetical protein DVG57_05435 [Salmonella enterica subsp. enterica serovar Typhimurium]|nr:hypothetical protein [Salmonella enterica subsp. enterica serovar Typhimurium]